MAAALKQLQSQASSYSKLVSTHGSKAYQQLLERNKQYIVGDASVETANELGKKYIFTTLASVPKRYEAALKDIDVLKGKWANRSELPLSEIGIGALFVAEVYAWFCVGEIIGRGGSMTGYKV